MIAPGNGDGQLSSRITEQGREGFKPGVRAGAIRYFAIVFAIGFLLGTIRILFVAPALGETGGQLVELPLMLLVSIAVARHTLTLHAINRPSQALALGLLAFLMLMATEGLTAWLFTGLDPVQWAATLVGTPGWIGFIGQLGFAFIPLLETWLNQRVAQQARDRNPRRPGPGSRRPPRR